MRGILLWKKKYTNKRELEIDTFFEHVGWYRLLTTVWGLYPSFSAARDVIFNLRQSTEEIKKIWKDNPDFSLPQLLASMGLFPIQKISKREGPTSDWYFSSIEDMMFEMGIPESEYLIWCSVYNRFGIRRKEPSCKLIKNMSTRHIKNVLKFKGAYKSEKIMDAFNAELQKRALKTFLPKGLHF